MLLGAAWRFLILPFFFSLIADTVKDMLDVNPSFMAPGHCSGWRAKAALEQALPGKVVSLGVGSDFVIKQSET